MTWLDRDRFVLSTGRTWYANAGIIGMKAEGPVAASEGYDGGLEAEDWTAGERLELALHMIARWQEWARGGGQEP